METDIDQKQDSQLEPLTKKDSHSLQKQQPKTTQPPTQDRFMEMLIEKGAPIVTEYLRTTYESKKHQTEKQTEYGLQELKSMDLLDRRDKIYKGILLIACIIALGVLAYFEKAQSVAPVLGVIIGLLLKNSSIGEFISGGRKKIETKSNEE